jgi:phosphate transport system substrate-binding protein
MKPAPTHTPLHDCSRRAWLTAILPFSSLTLPALWGCSRGRGPAGTEDATVIQNAGSDTIVNLAQAWAEEYATIEPSVSIEVSGGGSGTGIAALINGTVDIANASRRMDPAERARARAQTGREPEEFIVGYDALAVFVHPANPMDEITIPRIGEIYREDGRARRWSDLGVRNTACRGGRIIRVSRQSNSGTYHYFREAVLGGGADFKLGSLDLHGSKDVVELIARTPCAIGYSGMGYANKHVKALRVAKGEGLPAYPPAVETAQDGTYPIARPLYMYTAGEPRGAVAAFMKWVTTEAGQRLVRESGFVPLHPSTSG